MLFAYTYVFLYLSFYNVKNFFWNFFFFKLFFYSLFNK
jgi:hypothetical protein